MQVEIIGVPLDLGAGRRGVDMGPSALRIAGIQRRLAELGHNVHDLGDLPVPAPEGLTIERANLRYLPEIGATCSALAQAVERACQAGHFPLVLGGDHSIAIGTVAGVSSFRHRRGEKLGLLWFDAHGDMNNPESTPSGNIHGMPFAVCIGDGAQELTRIFAAGAAIDPRCAVLIGARSLDRRERELVKKSGIHVYTMREIDERHIGQVVGEAIEIASAETDALHVSFDMDCLDPSFAPGVGTPVAGGLSYREAHLAMELLADSGRVHSLEIVEVNPVLDVRNQTAELAAELITSSLGKRIL
ncbi:MAG TPA: arginase [Acidobacteriota bacterium]|jgi:arginase